MKPLNSELGEIGEILVANTKHLSAYHRGMVNIIITLPEATQAIEAYCKKREVGARIEELEWALSRKTTTEQAIDRLTELKLNKEEK